MNLLINGAEAIGNGNRGKVRISTKLQQVNAASLPVILTSGDDYAVVSAPATITSSAVEDDLGVTITVEPIVP